jgi:hypothetical protein
VPYTIKAVISSTIAVIASAALVYETSSPPMRIGKTRWIVNTSSG